MTTYIRGASDSEGYDQAMELLEQLYGGEIRRQQRAHAGFINCVPLKNLGHEELTRLFVVFGNLIRFHENNLTSNILIHPGNSDYRDGRRKLGKYLSQYDEWCMSHSESLNLRSIHKWLKIMNQSAILRSTLDYSGEYDNGVAYHGTAKGAGNRGKQHFKQREDRQNHPKERRDSFQGKHAPPATPP